MSQNNNEMNIVKKSFLNQLIIASLLCGGGTLSLSTHAAVKSGIDLAALDRNIDPKQDFYHFVNGNWIKTAKIPEDQALNGAMAEVSEKANAQIEDILKDLAKQAQPTDNALQKAADFYKSYLNHSKLESLGLTPLAEDLQRIENISSQKDLAKFFAYAEQTNLNLPFSLRIYQDTKASSKVLLFLGQGSVGLPDRAHYMSETPESEELRKEYLLYVANLLNFAGNEKPIENARTIMALEKALAKIRWTNLEMKNDEVNYHLFGTTNIKRFMPEFDWVEYFNELGFKPGRMIALKQINYLRDLNDLWKVIPLDTWKVYLKYNLINSYSPYLNDTFKDHRFAFYQKRLLGVQSQATRERDAVKITNSVLGEAIAPIYVEKHFDTAKIALVEKMIGNVRQAFHQHLDEAAWMSNGTKKEIREKLDDIKIKVGAPKKFEDYQGLEIRPNDLVGNIKRARLFEYQKELDKVGQPVDRDAWSMLPQSVNAYYNGQLNEIVFPAAILNPPYFDPEAENAINYGGIGAVIAHEIGHAFDDRGSKLNAKGRGPDPWSPSDRKEFEKRTKALIEQYSQYEAAKGQKVNGKLNTGENISDFLGLAMAHRAYQMSLGGQASPVLDGFTGDQRFFMGWAQVWRSKSNPEYILLHLNSSAHSPNPVRGNGAVRNHAKFFEAFNVKEGDKMYLAEKDRVTMW
jgi:putative endopeptidase